jgi:restriction system protein
MKTGHWFAAIGVAVAILGIPAALWLRWRARAQATPANVEATGAVNGALSGEERAWREGWAYDGPSILEHNTGYRLAWEASDAAPDIGDKTHGLAVREFEARGLSAIDARTCVHRLLGEGRRVRATMPFDATRDAGTKCQRLGRLAALRKASRWAGYPCVQDFHGGKYDSDHVSPLTKAASNVDARVFVLLQDWATDKNLAGPLDQDALDLGYTSSEPTVPRLAELLDRHLQTPLQDAYLTNLFPFVRVGDAIAPADLIKAAKTFAIPQIEIVRPQVVVCIGLRVFDALRRACGGGGVANIDGALSSPFRIYGAHVWVQAHTGFRGHSTRRPTRVEDDWRRMATCIESSM